MRNGFKDVYFEQLFGDLLEKSIKFNESIAGKEKFFKEIFERSVSLHYAFQMGGK
jgi:hypothetical protein